MPGTSLNNPLSQSSINHYNDDNSMETKANHSKYNANSLKGIFELQKNMQKGPKGSHSNSQLLDSTKATTAESQSLHNKFSINNSINQNPSNDSRTN